MVILHLHTSDIVLAWLGENYSIYLLDGWATGQTGTLVKASHTHMHTSNFFNACDSCKGFLDWAPWIFCKRSSLFLSHHWTVGEGGKFVYKISIQHDTYLSE